MLDHLRDRRSEAGWLTLRCGMVLVVTALPVSIALMNIGLVLAWVGAVVAQAPVHRTVGFWWGVAYAAWQLLSRAVAGLEGREAAGGFGSAYTWTGLCLAQVAFRGQEPGAVRARTWAMVGLCAGTVASVVVALGQFVIGRNAAAKPLRIDPEGVRFQRGTGFFAMHLTYGVIMMLVLLAALGGAFRSWWSWRWWQPLVATVAAIGLVVSFGRLAFLGVAIGAAALIASRGRRHLAVAAGVGCGLLLAGATILAVVQPARFERMMRLEDGRWPIWRTSMDIVTDHPLVGAGSTLAYRAAYRERYEQVNPGEWNEFPAGAPHAHNAPLALAAEHGLPAVILWLALLAVVLVATARRRGEGPGSWRTAAALVAGFLAAGQFENLAGDGESCHALWTLLGCCLASCPDHDQA